MENAYGIGVKNRYELFYDDEEDPIERIRQQEQELERKKTVVEKALKGPSKGSTTTTAKTGGKQANPATTVPAKKKDVPAGRISDAPTGTDQAPRSRPSKPLGGERGPSKFGPRGGGVGGNVGGGTGGGDDQRDLEERKNRRNREDRPAPTTGSEFRDRGGDGEMRRIGRGGRGGGRGGPGRGRGRGGMFDGRGKREFDRQSGSDKSGVKATEKRDGGGAHNWGTVKDEMDNSFNMSNEEPTETAERSGDEENAEPTEPKEGEEQPSVPGEGTGEDGIKIEDEGTKEMTLDEWKREQEQKRSVPKFNLRKPGEGDDGGQWQKKVFVLKKKENEEDDDEETEEEDDEVLRRGRQKQVVDIEINFSDSRRGRGRGRGGPRGGMGGPGGRGGRGGSGGGFNRGGIRESGPVNRGEREGGGDMWADRAPRERDRESKGKGSQQSAPKVDDWNDFPSLVAA